MQRSASKAVLTILLTGLISNGAFALFGPSTTDYLVRFEALAYLEDLYKSKAQLAKDIEKASSESGAITQAEIEQWNRVIASAQASLAEVATAQEQALDRLKLEQGIKKDATQKIIDQKKAELEQLITPKGLKGQLVKTTKEYINSYVWGTTKEEQLVIDEQARNDLVQEIAFLITKLNDLGKAPEMKDVKLSEAMKLQQQQANDAIAKAKIALENLRTRADVMHVKNRLTRLKSYESQFEKSAKCMIKLADCKDVKSWDSFKPSSTTRCKVEDLSQAQKKATNSLCAALTSTSPWRSVDACIPEYRAEILKKAGSEGARADFDKCRRF